jgi:hypothetical protein
MPSDIILPPDESDLVACATTIERRKLRRYPLRLAMRYVSRLTGGGRAVGTGLTCDLNSEGLRFTTQAEQIPDGQIVVTVAWPVRREGTTVKLVLMGTVLRSDRDGVAVAVQRHKLVACKAAAGLWFGRG